MVEHHRKSNASEFSVIVYYLPRHRPATFISVTNIFLFADSSWIWADKESDVTEVADAVDWNWGSDCNDQGGTPETEELVIVKDSSKKVYANKRVQNKSRDPKNLSNNSTASQNRSPLSIIRGVPSSGSEDHLRIVKGVPRIEESHVQVDETASRSEEIPRLAQNTSTGRRIPAGVCSIDDLFASDDSVSNVSNDRRVLPDGTPVTGDKNYTRPRIYHCKLCFKAYTHMVSLKRHCRLECGKQPQFQCPLCPLRSHHKSNLRAHALRAHNVIISCAEIGRATV